MKSPNNVYLHVSDAVHYIDNPTDILHRHKYTRVRELSDEECNRLWRTVFDTDMECGDVRTAIRTWYAKINGANITEK